MHKKPEILHKTIVAQSRLFDIESLHLRFNNGQERHFERVCGRGHGAVMMVPLLDAETILLVREYGVGVGEYTLGFPKGSIETDEDLLATAARELKEEVGYGARKFSVIARLSASPGYLHSMMHIVVATDLYPEKTSGDEPEPIEVIPWKLKQIDQLLKNPEFHEARSIAALFLIEKYFHGR